MVAERKGLFLFGSKTFWFTVTEKHNGFRRQNGTAATQQCGGGEHHSHFKPQGNFFLIAAEAPTHTPAESKEQQVFSSLPKHTQPPHR